MSARRTGIRVIGIGLTLLAGIAMTASTTFAAFQHTTYKPRLMGKEWVAVTGEPLSATAGARMFMKGGNAVGSTSTS